MSVAAVLESQVKDEAKIPRKLSPRNFSLSEYAYTRISATLPVGHTIEDALRPDYWSQVSYTLKQNVASGQPDRSGGIIELRTEDHSFYAELYVRSVREAALDVALVLGPVYLGPEEKASETDGYKPRWNVGARGFDIIRKSDGAIVGHATDFKLKEEAAAYIRDVLKG